MFCLNRPIIFKHWGRDEIDNISLTTFLELFFFSESVWISIKHSLKCVGKGPTNNIVALVQIIAWRRPGDMLLFEPVMVSLPTHICVIRPQWIYNAYLQTIAYWNVCYVYDSNIEFSKWRLWHFISASSLRCQSAPSHQAGHFVDKCPRDAEPWLSSCLPEQW